jgi:hypothetical protein
MRMAENKAEPTQTPDQPLAAVLRRALEDPSVRKDVRVALRVAGGAPGQTYALDVRAAGDGQAHAELRAERPQRQAAAERAEVTDVAFRRLLRQIVDSKLLDAAAPPPRFLPDTLVGYLEVAHGNTAHRAYFVADPEQARMQSVATPAELSKAVDAVYALGAGMLGRRSVKP